MNSCSLNDVVDVVLGLVAGRTGRLQSDGKNVGNSAVDLKHGDDDSEVRSHLKGRPGQEIPISGCYRV
jgi:hypothetical protein